MKLRLLGLAAASSLLLISLGYWARSASSSSVDNAPEWRKDYIGSKACASCHERKHQEWSQSLHSKMIQKAGPESVLGDFQKNNTLLHEGQSFRMAREGDEFFIDETLAGGTHTRYKVDFTLGSKRNQHYISVRPDGRMRVLFPTWDERAQKWFHSSAIIPTGHHADVPVQQWNEHCYNCHVSQEWKGFDIKTNTYRTSFTETGINCETCHGPGREHAERMKRDPDTLDFGILHPRSLPPDRQMMVCVQCHTPRAIVQHGFNPTKNYYDYYLPTLMHFYIDRWFDPPMWPDGRMRRFATEGAALWQSPCYLKGEATCITCHNPHLNTIKRDARFRDTDILCTQCHVALKDDAKVSLHTHHELGSEGSQCIGCHMPLETTMMQSLERDHSISIPVPENTVNYEVPNACTTCHKDKQAEWAVEWMTKWYPDRPQTNVRRAKAFVLARKRDPQAIDYLIALLHDPKENMVIRGSAAGFLGEYYGNAKVSAALVKALDDPEVMVRAEAARSLSEVPSAAAFEPLKKLLDDPNRVVRLNAVFALAKMGVQKVEGESSASFTRAMGELEKFFSDFPDDQSVRLNLGTHYALQGRYLQALQEYKNVVKLHPESPAAITANYYLGVTYAQLGLYDKSLDSFQRTIALKPDFRNTEDLIKQIREAMHQPQ